MDSKPKTIFSSNSGSGSLAIMSMCSTGKPPCSHSGIIEAFDLDSQDNLQSGHFNSVRSYLYASVLFLKH